MLNAEALMQLLPHRYPFLLVDSVAEFEPDVHVVAVKNVTHNEPFFAGHLPGTPVMPGMLVVEALAQAGGVLLMAGTADATAKVVYFASLDNVRWHGAVRPGDQLRLHVRVTHARGRMRKVRAEARVRDEVVCEAEMAAVVMDR
jgi:beta-hydroxyacyl-ACP dehydratase FabZ